ncbi:peptidylprolyl isomerase [Cytophagales bacterium LB-30]|uniref:Peptidylprolyl isomerase n=1 Tax=Shiella aurantiaca TaxID=3058365 RepID=A0ABT8F2J1_9BACT|nr:peptidylprolyl isomerase [Shiella aurantiaca]MDN4164642.1 peptidylprolyl isomerase [Shiella aurantiaca]
MPLTNRLLILLGIALGMSSCDLISFKKEEDASEITEKPIARAGEAYLYPSDIKDMVPKGTSVADSSSIIERYVSSWIRKQLLIRESASKIDFNEAEIERKILDYRYALMVFEYEKYYINENLNPEITEEEISTYYHENASNFELKQNIIRGLFLKVPADAPKIDKLRTLVQSNKPEDRTELKSYCFRFANAYTLEDSLWFNFDEVVSNTPFISVPNKVQFLKENKYTEITSEGFLYILKISDYKISDEQSPLEFVKEDIRNIILNKRKIELAKSLEEDIYKRAEKNNEFEIFP